MAVQMEQAPGTAARGGDTRETRGRVEAPTWTDLEALERRVENKATRGDGWMMATAALAAGAMLFSVIAVGFAVRAVDESKRNADAAATAATASIRAVASPATTVPPAVQLAPGAPIGIGLSEFHVAVPG